LLQTQRLQESLPQWPKNDGDYEWLLLTFGCSSLVDLLGKWMNGLPPLEDRNTVSFRKMHAAGPGGRQSEVVSSSN
jgi:hypothetical protein